MANTDYKIKYLVRNGINVEVKASFYEGNAAGGRYTRTSLLRTEIFNFTRVTDPEVRGLLNAELAKDISRTPINEQK